MYYIQLFIFTINNMICKVLLSYAAAATTTTTTTTTT